MEPEILKFEDIIKGCITRWKSILIFATFTAILAAIVLGTSNEVITYQGNFKTLIKSDVAVSENGTVVKEDPKLIQNYIEVMKTRNFAEDVVERTGLNLTPQEILTNLTLVNINNSDFIQVKYLSDNKEQTEKVITAIKDELLEVANDYSEDAVVSIEENVGIIEKTDIRNNKLLVVIGFIGGLGLAFVVAFILECINKTFKTKGEMERELKIPIIADIPMIKRTNSKMISENKVDGDFIKSFNSLAAEIKYGKSNEKIKSISVTSSVSGEGSTTVATNLALALSNSNKVILIDTNYENADINKNFAIEKRSGLSDVILNKVELKDAIFKNTNNLDILTTGDINVNTMEILDSNSFDRLLERLRSDYDYIVIDTAALQASSEAKLILRKVDGNVLVVKAESTKKDIVKATIKDIENLGSNLIGISFNFGDRFRNKYYTYKK